MQTDEESIAFNFCSNQHFAEIVKPAKETPVHVAREWISEGCSHVGNGLAMVLQRLPLAYGRTRLAMRIGHFMAFF